MDEYKRFIEIGYNRHRKYVLLHRELNGKRASTLRSKSLSPSATVHINKVVGVIYVYVYVAQLIHQYTVKIIYIYYTIQQLWIILQCFTMFYNVFSTLIVLLLKPILDFCSPRSSTIFYNVSQYFFNTHGVTFKAHPGKDHSQHVYKYKRGTDVGKEILYCSFLCVIDLTKISKWTCAACFALLVFQYSLQCVS